MSRKRSSKFRRKAGKRSRNRGQDHSVKNLKTEISPHNLYRCHRMACVQLVKWLGAVSDTGRGIYRQITEALKERGVYYLIGFLFGCGVMLMKGITPKFSRLLADANLTILGVTLVLGTLLFQGHKKIVIRKVSLKTVIFVLATAMLILVHGLFHSSY
jgi:hypothetical protein